jgi:phage gp37-like protein
MSRIGDIEDSLLARVRDRFGDTLRQVDAIPASWDDEMVKRYLIGTPGVFVSWGLDRGANTTDTTAEVNSLWQFTIITAHEGKESARRRGDARAIGAYEIVERLIPLMDGYTPAGETALAFDSAENLFSAANERNGLTVYGVLFSMPMTMGAVDEEPSDLEPFLRFHADWDQAPADGQLEAQDRVTLPQDPP